MDQAIDETMVGDIEKTNGSEDKKIKRQFITAKHLSDENHIHIRSCKNALEAWKILKTIYEG